MIHFLAKEIASLLGEERAITQTPVRSYLAYQLLATLTVELLLTVYLHNCSLP